MSPRNTGSSSPRSPSDPSQDLNALFYESSDMSTSVPFPTQSLHRLINYVKRALRDRSLFSSHPTRNLITRIACSMVSEDGQLSRTPNIIYPVAHDVIEDILVLPENEFGNRPPLQVKLSYTPAVPAASARNNDDLFHWWSLSISQASDPRFSRTSPLHVPSLSNWVIARARIHPLALCSATDVYPAGVTTDVGPISYVLPIVPPRSSLLFEFLIMSIEEGQPITALPPRPDTCEAPQWLQLALQQRSKANDLILAAKDDGNGHWTGVSFVEVNSARQVHANHRIRVGEPENAVCSYLGS